VTLKETEYIIKRDGKEVARVKSGVVTYDPVYGRVPNAVMQWLLQHQGQSAHYALKYGGYSFEKA
jgi:hypothetical protein